MDKPDEELFEVELDKVERAYDPGFAAETYDVTFACRRTRHRVEATVELDAEGLATLEIVPRAMAELHRVFAALTAQTRAWTDGEA